MKLTVPYKLKKIIPMLGIAAAPFLASCSKDDEPQRDVELVFSKYDSDAVSIENVTKYANDPSVRTVYMKVRDNEDYTHLAQRNIHYMQEAMEERLNISPKVRGRGDFHFAPGVAAKADSLFFVRNGWTVNQTQLQR